MPSRISWESWLSVCKALIIFIAHTENKRCESDEKNKKNANQWKGLAARNAHPHMRRPNENHQRYSTVCLTEYSINLFAHLIVPTAWTLATIHSYSARESGERANEARKGKREKDTWNALEVSGSTKAIVAAAVVVVAAAASPDDDAVTWYADTQ